MVTRVGKIAFNVSVVLLASVGNAAAATTILDRTAFENTLGTMITDDYSDTRYSHGDYGGYDSSNFHRYTDAGMSAVLGETTYQTTGFANSNMVSTGYAGNNGNFAYCAGCNGSFLLGFTSTSVGNAHGVFGVGFDMYYNYLSSSGDYYWPVPAGVGGYHAFVTFGDNSTADYALPLAAPIDPTTGHPSFWAITSPNGIKSIYIGTANGGISQQSTFVMDNLTIGAAAPVPEPESFGMMLAGLGMIAGVMSRREWRSGILA